MIIYYYIFYNNHKNAKPVWKTTLLQAEKFKAESFAPKKKQQQKNIFSIKNIPHLKYFFIGHTVMCLFYFLWAPACPPGRKPRQGGRRQHTAGRKPEAPGFEEFP